MERQIRPESERLIPRPLRHRLITCVSSDLVKQLVKIGVDGLVSTKRLLKLTQRVKAEEVGVDVAEIELLAERRGIAE